MPKRDNKIYRKVSESEVQSVIDANTGEVLEERKSSKMKYLEREPNYIKLYTDDIGRLFELPGSCSDVLAAIASHMAYKTNIIVLYGPIKKILMQELDMNLNTFNKAIDELYKKGMLIRLARACYMVDPELYGTGSWNDVKKVRLSIEYNPDGTKKVVTEVLRNLEGDKKEAIEMFQKRLKNQSKKQNKIQISSQKMPELPFQEEDQEAEEV